MTLTLISRFVVAIGLVGVSVLIGESVAVFDPYQDFPDKFQRSFEVSIQDVLFVIRSQAAAPHEQRAYQVKHDIQQQCRIRQLGEADVILSHEMYGISGQWTILPMLQELRQEYSAKKWIFFCEEDTRVNVQGLLRLLSRFSSEEEWFFGKGLFDQEATIIHHFRFHDMLSEFIFPDFDAGWILSRTLMHSIAARLKKESPQIDFSIDVKHELAHYIWNEEGGLHMTGLPQLCAGNVDQNSPPLTDEQILQQMAASKEHPPTSHSVCTTAYPKALPQCGDAVSGNDILFAVKTCQKFHKDRVPVVQKTWGRFADHLVYFSDKTDHSIPTVDCGVPNTERGHCGKAFAILNQFLTNAEYKQFKWLVIADDDTILSVSRLQRLLSCYDPSLPLILGERYGYGFTKGHGYDYITGGGGIVLSRPAVDTLLTMGCRCSKIEDPDDMIIGMCANRYNVPVAHSPLFHQARPVDYAKGLLSHQTPVSFHKHWNVNPIQVYDDWFLQDDLQGNNASHDEL